MVAVFCREKFLGALIYLTLYLPVHPLPPTFPLHQPSPSLPFFPGEPQERGEAAHGGPLLQGDGAHRAADGAGGRAAAHAAAGRGAQA